MNGRVVIVDDGAVALYAIDRSMDGYVLVPEDLPDVRIRISQADCEKYFDIETIEDDGE